MKETLKSSLLIIIGALLIFLPDPVFSLPLFLGIALACVGIFLCAEGLAILRNILMPPTRDKKQKEGFFGVFSVQ